jgi:AraC-like DNA-binding protein
MIIKTFKPSKALSSFIQFYWIFELDSRNIIEPHRIVPTGCVELMFQYGDGLLKMKNNEISLQPNSIITGQLTDFYDVIQTGKTAFLSVLFKPHAAKMFFDLPISELANQNIDINLILKSENKFIREQLALTKCHEEKITIIEDFLLGHLSEEKLYNFNRISKSIDLINSNFVDVKVSQLSDITCLSDKQFCRVFNDYVGLQPKNFIKIVRLQASIYYMQKLQPKSKTELAYLCGYYDQAHFIKDFKSFTGYTPNTYFKNDDIVSDYFLSS